MSHDLAVKIQLGLEELAIVHEQFKPLILTTSDAIIGVIETAAACAMLHSFYTEIEKILNSLLVSGTGRCLRPIHGTRICLTKCPRRPPSVRYSFACSGRSTE